MPPWFILGMDQMGTRSRRQQFRTDWRAARRNLLLRESEGTFTSDKQEGFAEDLGAPRRIHSLTTVSARKPKTFPCCCKTQQSNPHVLGISLPAVIAQCACPHGHADWKFSHALLSVDTA
jgi:hypothetical protein